MNTAVDPTNLINERPCLVNMGDDGVLYVADAVDQESGWLWVKQWSGSTAKLPPHRILAVSFVDLERYGEPDENTGRRPKRVADEKWRENAYDWSAADGADPIVADD